MSRVPAAGDRRFGRLIDRSRPLSFRFDGRKHIGYAGDTLASALIGEDIRVVGRSVKFHRPRGILGIGPEEPNALVTIGEGDRRTPNLLATGIPLHEGLVASSQNAWPSLRFDAASAIDRFRPLLPGGFQYKMFKWPVRAWPLYERIIRKTAGLGESPSLPDPDRYEHVNLHADVLIVGGGLAGLAAAEAVASDGLSVVLVEQDHRLGGIADGYEGQIEGAAVLDWVRERARLLAASRNVHILTGTTVAGIYDHGMALLVERSAEKYSGDEPENVPRERLWKLRSRAVVLATGAFEKPLVFPDNDRPGTMLATSARLYARRYGVLPGSRVVIATSGDEGYRTAFDLAAAGAHIEKVVDLRLVPDGSLFHIAKARGLPVVIGSAPMGSAGRRGSGLSGVTIGNRLTFDGPAVTTDIACDTLIVSGGWSPAPHLAGHLGARMRFDPELGAFVPRDLPPGLFVAGAANARFDAGAVLDDGWRAGSEAAAHIRNRSVPRTRDPFSVDVTQDYPVEPVGMLPDIASPQQRARAFIDLQNDATVGDMDLAVREGYGAAEHLKRYVAVGLGTDQGKLVTANAAQILAKITAADPEDIPHTTFRPPFTPVSFGVLAGTRRGAQFHPRRTTALSALLKPDLLETTGEWLLPACFPQPGESREDAVRREVRGVRERVGMFDASASASISLSGADAAVFLDRISATDLAGIAVGTSRHAVFLDANGYLLEDALVSCPAAGEFLVTAGVARGAGLADWFERHRQVNWPELDLVITDETERWGKVLLAGPAVPDLLARVPFTLDLDLVTAGSCLATRVFDIPARVLASRHAGAAEIEVSVPCGYLGTLWAQLIAAGGDLGVLPFGTATLQRLKLEAGWIDLDYEQDGTATPFDLGFADQVSADKTDFVGRNGLSRPAFAERKHLVGLLMEDRDFLPSPGTHLVAQPDQTPPRRVLGHITSSGYSPTLRRTIALALLAPGDHPAGAFILAAGEGKRVRITSSDFLASARSPA